MHLKFYLNLKNLRWISNIRNYLNSWVSDESQSLILIFYNSGWLFFDRLVRLSLGFFVTAWVVRYLGPSKFGELAYVLSYVAIFQMIAVLGLDGIVVRDIANKSKDVSLILGTTLFLRLCAGIFCLVCAIFGMILINGLSDLSVVLTAIAGGGLIFQAADTVDLWFQSQSQNRRTVVVKISAYMISSGIKIMLILIEAPLFAFALAVAIDSLIVALGLGIAYRDFRCSSKWMYTSNMARQLLKESWPFMLTGVSIALYMRIDQILIKEILGDRLLGVYAAVLPLATIWQFIPLTLMTTIAPMLAQKKNESEAAYWSALEKTFCIFSLLGWATCLPIAIFSGFLVDAIYGVKFHVGIATLAIYSFTNIFINLGVAQGVWILNERRSKIGLYKTLIGVIICIIGNLIFLPILGIIGAAIVAVLSQAISSVFSNIIFSRKIFYLQMKSLGYPFFRF